MSTPAPTTWCSNTGEAGLNSDWQSNHCQSENALWWVGQLVLMFAYCWGMLSTMYGMRRYHYVSVLRLLIVLASILLVSWATSVAGAADQTVYYLLFIFINLGHAFYIAYHEKPITLNDYLHNLWHKMFNMNGYNLELLDFYNLMQEKAFLKTYKKDQVYITEGDIPTQLSILLSGKMSVYKKDDFQRKSIYMAHESTHWERQREDDVIGEGEAYCGAVYPYEFIDSYEWLMSQGVFKYDGLANQAEQGVSQVTIKVSDDLEETGRSSECVVLTWKKEMLEAIFKEHPRLRVCIHSLVGKDIADKMLRITGVPSPDKDLTPDVDMVRKSHNSFRPTLRADVKNAYQTQLERNVLPIPSNRAATIYDDVYELEGEKIKNLTDAQQVVRDKLGAGPWCDLPNRELQESPWTMPVPKDLKDLDKSLLGQAKYSLQRARLRITNARLLGMNPGALESLQPSSDVAEQNKLHGGALLQYFQKNMPELRKRDLHEILKWGRWRTYYRPGTVLVRQGEEAHYVGLVLQGKLALYTEDEITRSESLVTYVHKYDLVGSEDFSSKFRTARRTIKMPKFVEPDANFRGPAPGVEVPPQLLPETLTGEELRYPESVDYEGKPEGGNLTDAYMYQNMSKHEALYHLCNKVLAKEDRDHLADRIDGVWGTGTATPDPQARLAALERNKEDHDDGKRLLVTSIPTVIFTWDIKDLKRLMLADPHVESSLSTLLRSDITFKLNSAAPTALGTRLCGVPTQARGDQDIRMCAVNND